MQEQAEEMRGRIFQCQSYDSALSIIGDYVNITAKEQAEDCLLYTSTYEVRVLKDGWTTVTADGKLSAHYENTVLITDGEPEILTVTEGL